MKCKDCKKKDTCEFLPMIKSAGITEHNCKHYVENKDYKAFNVNCNVRFKIDKKIGKNICEYWTRHYGRTQTLDFLFGKADEDGYRSCQFWSLMKYTGPFCDLGLTPPFETTIYFESKDLYEETK